MVNMTYKISVCVPAYNRPDSLAELLTSVIGQDYNDYEIVICEDHSPAQEQIRSVVGCIKESYQKVPIIYIENDKNLGYDANLRRLLEVAKGEYCLFMGDDDLLSPGALLRVGSVLDKYPNLGAINRAYRVLDRITGSVITESHYYPSDRYFPAGVKTAASFFRRFITISGLVVRRDSSLLLSTDKFDGSLLYQLYLVANLLLDLDGYFISDILALRRQGGEHFFGSSKAEKGLFTPRMLAPQHSINFMRGMLQIASYIEKTRSVPFHDRILADVAAYAYPYLCLHSANKRIFWKYARELSQLGLGKYPIFWIYVISLMMFNQSFLDKGINLVKRLIKRTPNIGGNYQGESAQ
jgi:abequosyltransferase